MTSRTERSTLNLAPKLCRYVGLLNGAYDMMDDTSDDLRNQRDVWVKGLCGIFPGMAVHLTICAKVRVSKQKPGAGTRFQSPVVPGST